MITMKPTYWFSENRKIPVVAFLATKGPNGGHNSSG